MPASFEKMVAKARAMLKRMNAHLDGDETAGPITQCLIMGMKISWGIYQLEYEDEKSVLFGKNTAVPVDAIPALLKLSKLHSEPYHLLRVICADLVEGGEALPKEVRAICAGFIKGDFSEPPKKTSDQRETPDHVHWMRRHAIILTLIALSDEFKIKPTRNRARTSPNLSGAQVVAEAISQIWDKSVNPKSGCPNERTIEGIWEKRAEVVNVFKNAELELRKLEATAT